MILKTIGSSSQGNCYILEAENGEKLMLEAAIRQERLIMQTKLDNVSACLITHSHGDHSAYAKYMLNRGIDLYCSNGTASRLGIDRYQSLKPNSIYSIGSFYVMPFDVKHDADEPLNFLIQHNEMGLMAFITDSAEMIKISDLVDHWLIEANYDSAIVDSMNDRSMDFLVNRIMNNHMSIEDALSTIMYNISHNNGEKPKSITFCHLSRLNQDIDKLKYECYEATGINADIAESGKCIELF